MKHIQSIRLPVCNVTALNNKIFKGKSRTGDTVAMNQLYLEFNGSPWLPSMGEFQYSRYPHEFWEDELLKIKAGGIEIVPTYVFWIHHEEEEGVFDWSGRRNVRRFVELCKKHGLWVIMRMGPFCHGEARNGGMPDWLFGKDLEPRSNDPKYLFYVKRLYNEIGEQLKGLTFKDGGPIIGIQCENEFMSSAAPWETTHNTAMLYTPVGSDGIAHMKILKKFAISAGLDVPLHTSTGWGGSPIDIDEFLPMFGGYGYYAWMDDPDSQGPSGFFRFQDMRHRKDCYRTDKVPFACCEIGGGMQPFYRNRPVVPPESVEAMHVVQLGSGSNLMGYYVYHGGSNPVGKHPFLNEHRCPRISYDFQAPLSEFGRRKPHYGMLRRQFVFLKDFGSRLAPMQTSIPEKVKSIEAGDTKSPRWAVRFKDGSGFVFINNFQDHAEMRDLKNLVFNVMDGNKTTLIPPSGGGLTLKKGKCALLPFNFMMDGLLLKSATVQPLARLDCRGTPHYFFFAPDGFPVEMQFDLANVAKLKMTGGKRKDNKSSIIVCRPGTGCLLEFTLDNGMRMLITVLTDEQSRNFWKEKFAGQERAFISENGLLVSDKKVDLYDVNKKEMGFLVYPPIGRKLSRTAGVITKEGIFQKFHLQAKNKSVGVSWKKLAEGKFSVAMPKTIGGDAEMFLMIDYIGDTGGAYIDGKLIHDNFWNGTTWEIGLKRYVPEISGKDLVIVITPVRSNDAKVKYSGMATMKIEKTGRELRDIRAIRIEMEQRAGVYLT